MKSNLLHKKRVHQSLTKHTCRSPLQSQNDDREFSYVCFYNSRPYENLFSDILPLRGKSLLLSLTILGWACNPLPLLKDLQLIVFKTFLYLTNIMKIIFHKINIVWLYFSQLSIGKFIIHYITFSVVRIPYKGILIWYRV